MYTLEYKTSVAKDLRTIPKSDLKKIVRRIKSLATDPQAQGCIKLQAKGELYRVRQGNYRVIYAIHEEQVVVLVIKVGHRRDVYER